MIARWHGLFVLGKDLDAAFDAAERIDTNARIILLGGALQSGIPLARERYAALARELSRKRTLNLTTEAQNVPRRKKICISWLFARYCAAITKNVLPLCLCVSC